MRLSITPKSRSYVVSIRIYGLTHMHRLIGLSEKSSRIARILDLSHNLNNNRSQNKTTKMMKKRIKNLKKRTRSYKNLRKKRSNQ
jgi:hypothetical protein